MLEVTVQRSYAECMYRLGEVLLKVTALLSGLTQRSKTTVLLALA